MENITLYHNLFLDCLIACIVLAALAVLLFFVLDIRSVAGYLTGRSRRTRIRKMEEENTQRKTDSVFRAEREIIMIHTEEEI